MSNYVRNDWRSDLRFKRCAKDLLSAHGYVGKFIARLQSYHGVIGCPPNPRPGSFWLSGALLFGAPFQNTYRAIITGLPPARLWSRPQRLGP